MKIRKATFNYFLNTPLFSLLCILFCSFTQIQAQNNLLLTQLNQLPQSLELNPSLNIENTQASLQLPFLSNINIGYSNNAFTINDLGPVFQLPYTAVNGPTDALSQVKDANRFSFNSRTTLLGGTYTINDIVLNLSVQERAEGSAYLPQGIYQLSAIHASNGIDSTGMHDITGLSLNFSHFRTIGLGASLPLNDNIRLGARLNYIIGMSNIWTDSEGTLSLNTTGESSLYDLTGALSVYGSRLDIYQNKGSRLSNYPFGTGNSGFSIDLGATVEYSPEWTFFGSILDLGFINWKTNTTGIQFIGMVDDPIQAFEAVTDNMIDGQHQTNSSYRTPLSAKIYLGGQHQLSELVQLGAVYHSSFIQGHSRHALSFSYHNQILPQLNVSGSYSIYDGSFFNLGTGLTANFGLVQAYFVTDNVLGLLKAGKSTNLHAGINLMLVKNQPTSKDTDESAIAQEQIREEKEKKKKTKPVKKQPTPTPVEKEQASPLPIRYTLQCILQDEESNEVTEAAYVDIYQIKPDNTKEIFRRTRFPGGTFELELNTSVRYEIAIDVYGYNPIALKVLGSEEPLIDGVLIKSVTISKK